MPEVRGTPAPSASLRDGRSADLYARAVGVLPGGVNSPVRAMRAIGRDPLFVARGEGAELVGELVQYEDSYKLCYVRGPEGIIVELAEKIG